MFDNIWFNSLLIVLMIESKFHVHIMLKWVEKIYSVLAKMIVGRHKQWGFGSNNEESAAMMSSRQQWWGVGGNDEELAAIIRS